MTTYNVVAVQRTPQSSGAPTLAELGPLEASIEYTDILNEAPEGKFVMDVDSLQADIKESLRDPVAQPLEVWVYRDSVRVFAGPAVGGELKDSMLTLTARGAEFYTAYMLVETAKTWAAVDQWTIATDVIDDWQAQTYGNYGIDTSAIGTSGTTRSLVIPGDEEPRIVYEVFLGLSGLDTFDWWVDPTDGELKLAASRGSDKSASVFLERGVLSPAVQFTVAPGIIGSEVYASSTGGDTVLTTSKSNTALRASWGRSGLPLAVDDDPDATTLGDAAQAYLDDRGNVFFIPGPEMIPVAGAGVGDFNVGDSVTYVFDAGLGQQAGTYRLRKRKVTVGNDGQERMAVDFA
jgi:hypothetical protein